MKKRNLIIIIGLILTAGLIFYLLKPEFLKNPVKSKPQASVQTAATAHQGHTAENKGPQAQVETQQKEQTEETPTVEIPLEKQQLIGVKTVAASVKPLQKIIRTVGRIEYDERRLATVNTKFEGWIEKLYVNYTGKYVKKGEPLAEIYSPELVATQQEFLNVLKWSKPGADKDSAVGKMLSKDAEAITEAAKQRLRLWDINDAQIKKIEEAGKPI
ncbi:MAG: efflux RND transporter periplasmic adaptor subunit, partial [Nitrospirota bacterium]|nr:efflux RND transporter periplasmic adaptor subunit [Nitrospirota bacterium]